MKKKQPEIVTLAICYVYKCNNKCSTLVSIDSKQKVAVCESHSDYSEGAEFHGRPENFHKRNPQCKDWTKDEQYGIDNPEGLENYEKSIEQDGEICLHCLSICACVQEPCVHKKALAQK